MNWVHMLLELVESSFHPDVITGMSALHKGTARRAPAWARQGLVLAAPGTLCLPGLGRAHEEKSKGQSKAPAGPGAL